MDEKQTQQHRQHFNLSESAKHMLEELTAQRYPGKQRRQSQLIEDLITEAFAKERAVKNISPMPQEPEFDRFAASTHEAIHLDKALFRAGRFDHRVVVRRPSSDASESVGYLSPRQGPMPGGKVSRFIAPRGGVEQPCPLCKREVQPQWKYCVYCGAPLAKFCPKCGAPRADVEGAKFCFECGNELS